MKNTLTLSALFALTLAPAAFANGAQEQTQASTADTTPSSSVAVTDSTGQAPDATSITRSVLERLELDVRAELLSGLRESGLLMLQIAAPVLGESTVAKPQLDLTAR